MLTDPGFALVSADRAAAPLAPSGLLDGVPEAVAEQARWWERHIVEILTGLPPEHEPGAVPKPEYDPGSVSGSPVVLGKFWSDIPALRLSRGRYRREISRWLSLGRCARSTPRRR